MSMIELKNVTKTYGDVVAVKDLSLEIEQGELATLLGESGCGKTTTIRCIAGLEEIDSGEIYIDGELHSSGEEGILIPPRKKNLGMVFQSYAIWPHKSVFRNVSYGLEVRDISKSEQRERVADVLERVGLSGFEERKPTELSGGQQQRVVLARSLVYEPKALLLDEPLANLDAKLRENLQKEIKRLQRDLDISFLYVTHNQEEAMVLSDKIAILNDGEMIEWDEPEQIYSNPTNLYSAEFIGKANIFDIHDIKNNSTTATVTSPIGQIRINSTPDITDGNKLLIRPHQFEFGTDGTENRYTLTLSEVFYTGGFIEATGSINDTEVIIQTTAHGKERMEPGSEFEVSIDPHSPTIL